MLHYQFLLVSYRIGTKEALALVYQTADGETVPTNIVTGRGNTWSIEVEAVSYSIPGTSPINSSNTRPTVAMDAEVPHSAGIESDVPATDEA